MTATITDSLHAKLQALLARSDYQGVIRELKRASITNKTVFSLEEGIAYVDLTDGYVLSWSFEWDSGLDEHVWKVWLDVHALDQILLHRFRGEADRPERAREYAERIHRAIRDKSPEIDCPEIAKALLSESGEV